MGYLLSKQKNRWAGINVPGNFQLLYFGLLKMELDSNSPGII